MRTFPPTSFLSNFFLFFSINKGVRANFFGEKLSTIYNGVYPLLHTATMNQIYKQLNAKLIISDSSDVEIDTKAGTFIVSRADATWLHNAFKDIDSIEPGAEKSNGHLTDPYVRLAIKQQVEEKYATAQNCGLSLRFSAFHTNPLWEENIQIVRKNAQRGFLLAEAHPKSPKLSSEEDIWKMATLVTHAGMTKRISDRAYQMCSPDKKCLLHFARYAKEFATMTSWWDRNHKGPMGAEHYITWNVFDGIDYSGTVAILEHEYGHRAFKTLLENRGKRNLLALLESAELTPEERRAVQDFRQLYNRSPKASVRDAMMYYLEEGNDSDLLKHMSDSSFQFMKKNRAKSFHTLAEMNQDDFNAAFYLPSNTILGLLKFAATYNKAVNFDLNEADLQSVTEKTEALLAKMGGTSPQDLVVILRMMNLVKGVVLSEEYKRIVQDLKRENF